MKNILALALIGLAGIFNQSFSQSKSENLLDISDIKTIGLYVAPEYQFGQLGGSFTNFGGGSVMFILNNQFSVGASGFRNISETFSPAKYSPLFAEARVAGGKAEYTINPEGLVHFTIPLFVGFGNVSLDSNDIRFHHDDWWDNSWDNSIDMNNDFLVIQTGANAEVNLFKYAKFFVGANYRYSTVKDNISILDNSMLQGLSFSAGLKLGLFDFSVQGK